MPRCYSYCNRYGHYRRFRLSYAKHVERTCFGPNLFLSMRLYLGHSVHLFVTCYSAEHISTMYGALGALQITKQHLAKLLFGLSFIPSLGLASIVIRSAIHYGLWRTLLIGLTSCAPVAYLVRGFSRSAGSSQRRHQESLFWRELLPCLIGKHILLKYAFIRTLLISAI